MFYLLQNWWRKSMLEFRECIYCSGQSWPSHALCWEAPGDLQRGMMVTRVCWLPGFCCHWEPGRGYFRLWFVLLMYFIKKMALAVFNKKNLLNPFLLEFWEESFLCKYICICFWYSNRTGYFIWLQVGDRSGELTARLNLSDLQMVLGLSYSTNTSMMSESHAVDNSLNGMCFSPNTF